MLLNIIAARNEYFVTIGIFIAGLNFKILFAMGVMIWRCCAIVLEMLLLSLLRCLLSLCYTWHQQIWSNSFVKKLYAWWLWVYIKCMSKKSILKIESITIILKILKMQNNQKIKIFFLINEKNYNDMVIYFTRYVHSKSIKVLSLLYHELMGKIEEYEGKKYLIIDDDCMLDKVLDKIKEIIGIEKFDDTKLMMINCRMILL